MSDNVGKPSKKPSEQPHFTERIANLGIVFIISGVLSFFGLNNYAPYSYYAFSASELTRSFWFGNFTWFALVILWALFPMVLSIRLFRIRKEMANLHYNRFSLLYLVSSIIQFLTPVILTVLYLTAFFEMSELEFLPNPASYFPTIVYFGFIYIAITMIIQIMQFIAWISLLLLSREGKSSLSKDVQLNFGRAPVVFLLGAITSITALTISTVASSILLSGNTEQADFLTMIGTYVYFGWLGLTLLGNVMVGIKIFNKPSSVTNKTVVTKQVKVKKVLKSCPVCMDTIYEGQNICKNCGYRI